MSIPFRLLILLIAASPATLFAGGAMTHGLVALTTAIAVGAVARGIRPGEAEHLARFIQPFAIILAVPAVWMLIQALPMPVSGLANPMWASAAAALGRSIIGSISIDPGATLLSLIRYLSVVGIGLTTAAVAIDRRRAEWVLFWLTGVTTATACLLVVNSSGVVGFLGGANDAVRAEPMAALAALGTVIAGCAAIRAFERYETRRSAHDMTFGKFARAVTIALAALAICWFALAGRPTQTFAAICGTAAVVLIEVTRRLNLSRWIGAAIAGVAIIVASAVALSNSNTVGDLTLRFARGAPTATVPVAERIMADTRWTGSGAGTFSALAPIYRDITETGGSMAPTTAAATAIELGRPSLLIAVLTLIAVATLLVRGALQRGRDSFYPVAGVGCTIALTIEGFTDATALSTAIQIIAAAILGLALAQSVSRTNQ